MKNLLLCAMVALLGLAEQEMPSKSKWAPSSLDVESFSELVVSPDGTILSKKPWFVKYYAPWCGHCQALEPVWEEFNSKHQDEINVGSVDCTSQLGQPLC